MITHNNLVCKGTDKDMSLLRNITDFFLTWAVFHTLPTGLSGRSGVHAGSSLLWSSIKYFIHNNNHYPKTPNNTLVITVFLLHSSFFVFIIYLFICRQPPSFHCERDSKQKPPVHSNNHVVLFCVNTFAICHWLLSSPCKPNPLFEPFIMSGICSLLTPPPLLCYAWRQLKCG